MHSKKHVRGTSTVTCQIQGNQVLRMFYRAIQRIMFELFWHVMLSVMWSIYCCITIGYSCPWPGGFHNRLPSGHGASGWRRGEREQGHFYNCSISAEISFKAKLKILHYNPLTTRATPKAPAVAQAWVSPKASHCQGKNIGSTLQVAIFCLVLTKSFVWAEVGKQIEGTRVATEEVR